jgi:2-oxoglutarate ferredoxin oxidoreductase subunit beta
MPEAAFAELDFKSKLKMDLFPTIWCPGCGIGTIMIELAMVLDELGLDQTNTVIVTGIGCTGRMGSYMKYDAVYTLHGRTLPVAEAIKTVRPELHVIVVAGDGDTASIGGNHLIHAIRRNARVTVLCNNNEIYGLTGGQTGPTTPSGTKTLSSPGGNPNTPINLQGIVRSSPHALYARTTVYHQPQMRTAIREAIQHDGFSFVDITSQCIENNGRRIGFANANEMLTFYRKTYKRAPKGADRLGPFELGILYPEGHAELTNGQTDAGAPADQQSPINGAASATETAARTEAAAPEAPAAAPGAERPSVSEDEKARKRAESQKKLALMQRLDPAVKLQVAKGELTLADALQAAGIDPAELES